MAIKSSNQITFTEHKKIKQIKEYYLATSASTGVTTDPANGWTQDIQTIDYKNKYLWNYEEVVYSIGASEISEPVIIGFYGEGADGKGIKNIVNYYAITQDLILPDPIPDDFWKDSFITAGTLTSTNKYLWNCEVIIYTDGTTTQTDPAIIGVYGDSGANAITFEIYSTQGFMFKEDLTSIELKIAAFEGGNLLTNVDRCTWSWWNDSLNDGAGGYQIIFSAPSTTPSLRVDKTNQFAFASLKCSIEYKGNTYEDYVMLTDETIIYTGVVKFFDGSNVFHADDPYIIAYLELYQNDKEEPIETIDTTVNEYYSLASVSNGVITADIDGKVNGDKMYFVYQDDDGGYQVALGQYESNVWRVVNKELKYKYINTIQPGIQSNIIVISKEQINKSDNIDFKIYKDDKYVATASAMVIDANDPIIGNQPPQNPADGQLWFNTGVSPNVLQVYQKANNTWVDCTEYVGKTVYTSQPGSYSKGDLWILDDGEKCGNFEAGSMLKATTDSTKFNASHWVDADKKLTELMNNIAQTFEFDYNDEDGDGLYGLKIKQMDGRFWVNIDSSEMGFYDDSDKDGVGTKVVAIGNKSATIKNMIVNDNATFNCRTTFNEEVNMQGFVWQKESNGSFSLALAT